VEQGLTIITIITIIIITIITIIINVLKSSSSSSPSTYYHHHHQPIIIIITSTFCEISMILFLVCFKYFWNVDTCPSIASFIFARPPRFPFISEE